jgi:hypothetical protein
LGGGAGAEATAVVGGGVHRGHNTGKQSDEKEGNGEEKEGELTSEKWRRAGPQASNAESPKNTTTSVPVPAEKQRKGALVFDDYSSPVAAAAASETSSESSETSSPASSETAPETSPELSETSPESSETSSPALSETAPESSETSPESSETSSPESSETEPASSPAAASEPSPSASPEKTSSHPGRGDHAARRPPPKHLRVFPGDFIVVRCRYSSSLLNGEGNGGSREVYFDGAVQVLNGVDP